MIKVRMKCGKGDDRIRSYYKDKSYSSYSSRIHIFYKCVLCNFAYHTDLNVRLLLMQSNIVDINLYSHSTEILPLPLLLLLLLSLVLTEP
jgi:hypothetical protein